MLFEYESKLEPLSNVTVMVLDSATTGRLSMTMYTQMEHSVFFERLQAWHEQTGDIGEKRNFRFSHFLCMILQIVHTGQSRQMF